jgi:(p)ppGpp synthase/HD superfamily hydrolase
VNHEYLAALAYATKAHGGQLRKGTEIPYITHPMGVASIVLDYGGTQEQAIAALLHDVVEDCGGVPRLDDVREVFGRRVADIVALCSDSLRDSGEKSEWCARKEHHLAHLEKYLTPVEAVVIAADKLHNLRSIHRDLISDGNAVWSRFKGGESGTRWYYAQMISTLSFVACDGTDTDGRPTGNGGIVWRITAELERMFGEVWP